MAEEDVHEADDLHGLAETHGVGQDAAEARCGVVLHQRLHNVVVQESDPTHLHEERWVGRGSGRGGNKKKEGQSECDKFHNEINEIFSLKVVFK